MNYTIDVLWKIYENTSEWIRFADTKASIIIGINAILAGFIASNISAIRSYLIGSPSLVVLTILAVISGVASVYFAIKCLSPTLDVGEPTSLIYFAHIALGFDSAKKYSQQLHDCINDQHRFYDHISSEIWANSKIGWKKYKSTLIANLCFSDPPGKMEVSTLNAPGV